MKWTPDGAARLTNKTQRYISPAFETDPETRRITKIINTALVAMPATHNAPALIAAAARGGIKKMSNFDDSDPKHPKPAEMRAHFCDALGLAPHATDDELREAFEGLLGQAGTTPDAPQRNKAIDPTVVSSARAPVDPKAVELGRRALGWK